MLATSEKRVCVREVKILGSPAHLWEKSFLRGLSDACKVAVEKEKTKRHHIN